MSFINRLFWGVLITTFSCRSIFAASKLGVPVFTKDVAPILFNNCATCHRPNEIGPFSLLTYQDARKKATMIVRVTNDRIMPPWKPEPGFGDFLYARRLSESQLSVLKAWVDAGCPEGDPTDLPPRPIFKDGWQLGEPDVVVKMPTAFSVPAEGRDIYMHFVFPLGFDQDKYLRGIEVRPSNRRVAHHGIGILDMSGTARRLAALHGGVGYPGLGGPGFIPSGFTPGYAPGQTARFFPDDSALTLKRGEDFVLQMHYHPDGKPESDQTVVGLYLTDKRPERGIGGILMGSETIDIPPGERAHKITDSFKVPVEYEFRNIWAHMHMVGKEVHAWAELPHGGIQELLKITAWDFNWQDAYTYAKPFRLPKGTVLKAEFIYDNSADNPRNPNDPPKRVTLGENSTDEMAGLWIGGLPVNPREEWIIWASVIAHYLDVHSRATVPRK